MACYHPLQSFRYECGKVRPEMQVSEWLKTSQMWPRGAVESLVLPCSRCVGCRLTRSRQWAIRAMHEARMHEDNCFITLTFSPFTWVSNGNRKNWFDIREDSSASLRYVEYQKFMKRLRKRFKGVKIRFYMAGEYGENFGRPHFHAILFGMDFPDRDFFSRTASGASIYRSKILEQLWPYGFSSVGDFTFESAAYVARYCMKKITGDEADLHYETIDRATGEVIWRLPEFNRMSLKPGIGGAWLEKYQSDVFPHDHVIVNGKECAVPRYYDKLYDRKTLETFVKPVTLSTGQVIAQESVSISPHMEEIKMQRMNKAQLQLDDNTPERLEVKEQVARANLLRLKRKLV